MELTKQAENAFSSQVHTIPDSGGMKAQLRAQGKQFSQGFSRTGSWNNHLSLQKVSI